MKYAAIDVGLKRIGIALSDGKIVFPQEAVLRKGRKQAANDLSRFLREWEVEELIVGLPRGGSSEEEMERRIRHFLSLLDLKDNMPLHFINEAGSSYEAKESMKGVIRQKRDGRIDSIAAKIILERFLERGEQIS